MFTKKIWNFIVGYRMSVGCQKIYDMAIRWMGFDIQLDPNVPNDFGCAQAVSFILKKCGYAIPEMGISGTYNLLGWLKQNFQEVSEYTVGAVIISATGTGNGQLKNGHVGICAKHGILSNDSNSGLFLELWNIEKWKKYYEKYGGMKTRYFAPVDNLV